jgi:hypothetical protein
MQDKLKNGVTISITILALIPFILLTDLFPFFRFGMFAEPLKSSIQTEVFHVTVIHDDGMEEVFDPKEMSINSSDFNYLCRNYYYRKEGEIFLSKLSTVFKQKGIRAWTIKRTLYHDAKESNSTVAKIIIQP